MSFRTVPALSPRYWVVMTLASIFGANLGDFVSHDLHMGHINGVPYLAAAFALIAIGGTVGRAAEGWYWLGVVTLRTMATNLADLATHDGALGTVPVCTVLAAVMVSLLLIRRTTATTTATAVPRADAGYWLVMLVAGTLGTALGDGLTDEISLPIVTVVTAIGVVVALGLRMRPVIGPVASYWLAIVAIRTFGTNMGDLIAHGWTLAVSTPLSGAALLLVLFAWRQRTARVDALAS